MTGIMKFSKVIDELPSIVDPSTQYLVFDSSANKVKLYVSDKNGNIIHKVIDGTPSIKGENLLIKGQVAEYIITNYDKDTIYDLSLTPGTVNGNVSIDKDIISYRGDVVGTGGFIINEKQTTIAIIDEFVNPPSINPIPLNSVTSVVILTSTAFNPYNEFCKHYSSTWEISTSASFATIYTSVTDDVVNLTSLEVFNLLPNVDYYVRVKYTSIFGYTSDWSQTLSFRTKAYFTPSKVIANLSSNSNNYSDNFGCSIAIADQFNEIVIGASQYNYKGAVMVFTHSNSGVFSELTIQPNDLILNSNFGNSCSISADGNVLVVGASQDTVGSVNNCGSAYIYTRVNGVLTQTAKISASDKGNNFYFGMSVTISRDGSTIAIASPYATVGSVTYAGKVYIFTKVAGVWTQTSILNLATNVNNQMFSSSLAINSDGTIIVVGAYGISNYRGAAYVFKKVNNIWSLTNTLTASNPVNNGYFGMSCSISDNGSTIAIASPHATVGSIAYAGAVYVFKANGAAYQQTTILTDTAPVQYGYYGNFVDISGDGNIILIGSPNETVNGIPYTGAAFIYTYSANAWSLTNTLLSNIVIEGYAQFASVGCISYDGTTAAVNSNSYSFMGYPNKPNVYLFV